MSRTLRLMALLFVALSCARDETPATMRDDAGRAVGLPKHVRRVVTLAPNVTQIVYAIGAGDSIVGTDDFSDDPPAAKKLPKVGNMQPNVEKIAALRPDLAITVSSASYPTLGPALAAVNIPLFVIRTERLAEIPTAMDRVGVVVGSRAAHDAAA